MQKIHLNSAFGPRRAHISQRNVGLRSTPASMDIWKGSDEFTELNDRRDVAPLPLPPVTEPRRVTLVRHGQSTWNADGRIQGSSNFSVLTDKGIQQAELAREVLKSERYDLMFHSPLARASQTAQIVWNKRPGAVKALPSLREIDLYSFQGLVKADGKARFGPAYAKWQKEPASFEIDGQAPVRELWYRASLAWQVLLSPAARPNENRSVLVVAHNAINQALIGTALGLPPTYFRRIIQTNAASTVLDFLPDASNGDQAIVTVERLNSGTAKPFKAPAADPKAPHRVVLVHRGHTEGSGASTPLSSLGHSEAQRVATLLADLPLLRVLSAESASGSQCADAIASKQKGVAASRSAACEAGISGAKALWTEMREAALGGPAGSAVAAVVDERTHGALIAACLGMEAKEGDRTFCLAPGNISVIEFSSASDPGSIKTLNYSIVQ